MAGVVREVPAGWALLVNHGRFGDARALDVATLRFRRLRRAPVLDDELVHGHFARRQGRTHALLRWEDRLTYLCGRRRWDVEEAQVRRRARGLARSLTFTGDDGAVIGTCRWLESELARRWFIPASVDPTPFVDSEDFDWSLFVEAVLSSDRRDRVGRPLD